MKILAHFKRNDFSASNISKFEQGNDFTLPFILKMLEHADCAEIIDNDKIVVQLTTGTTLVFQGTENEILIIDEKCN